MRKIDGRSKGVRGDPYMKAIFAKGKKKRKSKKQDKVNDAISGFIMRLIGVFILLIIGAMIFG